jgi:peptide/nickel transport system ATP-binding protein
LTDSIPILSIERLGVEFALPDGNVVRAVDELSLAIEAGEIHALVGESGAGKSTVGNAVIGLIERPGRIVAGTILVKGQPLQTGKGEQVVIPGRDIGAIFQNPMTSLNPLFTVGSQLVETIRHHMRLGAQASRERALELLRSVEMPEPERRFSFYPHQLSGGQRQRVVIAAALSCHPKLLVADEPTTALDVSVQTQILKLIRRLADERQLGVLFVTHNLAAVAQIADRLTIMRNGRVIEDGSVARILSAPQHDYARILIQSVPRFDAPMARLADLGEEKEAGVKARELLRASVPQALTAEETSNPILKVENLTVEYSHRKWPRGQQKFRALDDVSFSVRRGEIFGIVGESGSGKTTLANAIAGLITPTKGQIIFRNQPISSNRKTTVRRAIQMIFQDPYSSLNPRMRIGNAIAEPVAFYGLAKSWAKAANQAESLLDAVGMDGGFFRRYPHAFSGGQRQRISIARALAAQPNLLICDEPTSSLDVSVQANILNFLKDLRDATQLTLVFISHDLAVVRQMCDRIAVMNSGRIVEFADCETIFKAPQHAYTKHLISCVPSMNVAMRSQRSHKRREHGAVPTHFEVGP